MQHGDAAVGELFQGLQGDPPIHQAEIAAGVMNGIVDQHQVRQAAGGQCQGREVDIGADVAIDQHEGFTTQQWQRPKDTAPGLQRLTFGGKANGDTQATAVAQDGFQLVAQPGVVDHQVGDTSGGQRLDMVLDERTTVHFDQWLGARQRQRTHPFALARRQDHGLHGWARSACNSSSRAPRSASSGRRATTVRI